MINSNAMRVLAPLLEKIENSRGKTIREIKSELNIERENMIKGASGLIIENLLGIPNNNTDDADIPEIGCEVKTLPLQLNRNGLFKVKEPTAIQMIDYFKVAKETWETAKIRKKITFTFWIVFLAKEGGLPLHQDDYIVLDWYLDYPCNSETEIFKKDWEEIQDFIIRGLSDELSCSMGEYIEPKTKGANNQDKTDAPDGNGGILKARRRAFYYKKNYTNNHIVPNLDLSVLNRENN